jgi:hypothetical protein
MLFRVKFAVSSELRIKHLSIFPGQKVEFIIFKAAGK